MKAQPETPGERIARLHSTLVARVIDLWELESDVIRHYKGTPQLGAAIVERFSDPQEQVKRWRLTTPWGDYPPAVLKARRAMFGDRPTDTPAAQAYLALNPSRHIAEALLSGGDTLTRLDLQSLEEMHALYTSRTDASDPGKGGRRPA